MVAQQEERTESPVSPDEDIRQRLLRYWENLGDQELVAEVYHDDAVLDFPQGGERIVGLANIQAMRAAYPANVAMRIQKIHGGGPLRVGEMVGTYDGATSAHGVSILEFRTGKVARETIYVGDPWDPPAWRVQWAEPMDELSGRNTSGAPQ